MAKFKLTKARFEELQAELYSLQTDGEKEVAEKLKEARSFGDLSENSEYDEAKNEQGRLYSRIAELKDLIENAELIQELSHVSQVAVGSTVTALNKNTNSEKTYKIVGTREADPRKGQLSEESPIGRALLGHDVGEEVVAETPNGNTAFKIIKIDF
ncbi:MAG: transcription elongation factor GreA [Oscillospiraceae bacterium]|jgi:transcription elongation factor GreA|nr:transcription elongation factor GreA [Oscillospiraceae bacterium]